MADELTAPATSVQPDIPLVSRLNLHIRAQPVNKSFAYWTVVPRKDGEIPKRILGERRLRFRKHHCYWRCYPEYLPRVCLFIESAVSLSESAFAGWFPVVRDDLKG